jgi:CubicO group peptidase (beta-lactamase class C family)
MSADNDDMAAGADAWGAPWIALVLLALGGCLGAGDRTGASTEAEDSLHALHAWSRGELADAGFDPAALEQLVVDIDRGMFGNTHALLIEHDGALVFERYFPGADERWGEPIPLRMMGPDSLHDLRSVTKGVTSTLLGIALGDDFQEAVARPIADYLPALAAEAAAREINLHHLLTMTAGLRWNEMTVPYTDPMNDEIRLYEARDPARYVMTRPAARPPGDTWYYSGGTTQVLAAVISELTGQRLDEFARERLFEPLGVSEFEWLGPEGWTPDNPAAMSGLRLRPRDLAKIGSLYLHRGRWRGRRVVPEAWVERAMARHVEEIGDWSDGGIWGYGYQWWVGDLPTGERVVAGVGNGNQRLFILPAERLVVTVLAGDYNVFEGHGERILDRVLAAR